MILYKKHDGLDQKKHRITKEIRDFLKVTQGDFEYYEILQFEQPIDEIAIAKEVFDLSAGGVSFAFPELKATERALRIIDKQGQYHQQQDMVKTYLSTFKNIDTEVLASELYIFSALSDSEFATISSYLINPVVSESVPLDFAHYAYDTSDDDELGEVTGFTEMSSETLTDFIRDFSFDLDDSFYLQDYYRTIGRQPKWIELKILDTYWSDHCRHTTFLTHIDRVSTGGFYKTLIDETLENYKSSRHDVYGDAPKPMTLMDVTTINMKEMRMRGDLEDLEVSSEVNACSLKKDIDVDGELIPHLVMFKNETHNHPTEIEPYGGAHTCIGGGIRDPLSGRAHVYQSMRITGCGDPKKAYEETLPNKLPQRYITNTALAGFSDYANQIGLNASYAREFYHPGFEAKRMELGALMAVAPAANVRREEPVPGDVILLLGADTGRDGLGAAVGSSKVQTTESLKKAGAEVQKGNPFVERHIIRLFKRHDAASLIKKCNDFGAGGVAIAVTELAEGLDIYLDRVNLKYPGLNAYEVALSESQERMAVVVSREDLDRFTALCDEEDVAYVLVADVNASNRMRMFWGEDVVAEFDRALLDSAGAVKHMDAEIAIAKSDLYANAPEDIEGILTSLNGASQKNLGHYFDSTIDRVAYHLQYGGDTGLTSELGMVGRIPVAGHTETCSIMTSGYFPEIGEKSSFHAGFCAVVDSVAKIVATGGDPTTARLTFQEYFPSIKQDPARFGMPLAALLGAYRAMADLNVPCVGGKDSMSGTFGAIDVPPTLVSFAVATERAEHIVSRGLKGRGHNLYITEVTVDEHGVIDGEGLNVSFKKVRDLVLDKKVYAASTLTSQGLFHTLLEMGFGNEVAFHIESSELYRYAPGAIVIETDEELGDGFIRLGTTAGDLVVNGVAYDFDALKTMYQSANAPIFFTPKTHRTSPVVVTKRGEYSAFEGEKAVIPVLLGATGEYDCAAFLVQRGYQVETIVLRTSSHRAFSEDLVHLAKAIDAADLLYLPNGDYYGSAIGNGSRPLAVVLQDKKVKLAIEALRRRKGMVVGVGMGFCAMVEAGVFGELDLAFNANTDHTFLHSLETFTVVNASPVTAKMPQHSTYSAPVAGKKLDVSTANLKTLEEQVTIVSVAEEAYMSGISQINGILSKDGTAYGELSLFDRMDETLYTNVPVANQPDHFRR